ncbi:MAG: hypothetical protein ACJA1Z_002509 [Patiriisocius sp.]
MKIIDFFETNEQISFFKEMTKEHTDATEPPKTIVKKSLEKQDAFFP